MARKTFGYVSSHRGFILIEALLAAVILALASLSVFPVYTGWQEEKKLESAAEEIVSAIRQAEILAKNEWAAYPDLAEGLTFVCETTADGTGRYYTSKGTERIRPKGNLPKGIRVDSGNVSIRFRKNNLAGESKKHSILLMTDDKKYKRLITVAMYTGRVRVEKVK